jgi:hypothetical protein
MPSMKPLSGSDRPLSTSLRPSSSSRAPSGDPLLTPKDAPHSVRNTGSENLVCILAQSPLPCEHVAVGK